MILRPPLAFPNLWLLGLRRVITGAQGVAVGRRPQGGGGFIAVAGAPGLALFDVTEVPFFAFSLLEGLGVVVLQCVMFRVQPTCVLVPHMQLAVAETA